jgi:endonuclease YncB( thermonuclease family)
MCDPIQLVDAPSHDAAQGWAQRAAAIVLMLSLACVPPAAAAAAADSFQGVPRIVDGDTLVVSRSCQSY